MKQHQASEMRYTADIMAPDGETVILAQCGAGIEDLEGRAVEQAQLIASRTTHKVLLWWADAVSLPDGGYLRVTDPWTGAVTLYVVDAPPLDPRKPRPRVWAEVFCHAERSGS
jgi:hypothetical protein